MDAAAFRRAIERLGLTQAGAAALVGRSPRASRRWAAGEVPIAEAIVLQLLLDGKISMEDVEQARRRAVRT
jgi:hypothetical protein